MYDPQSRILVKIEKPPCNPANNLEALMPI
jgi:hypothetical protein